MLSDFSSKCSEFLFLMCLLFLGFPLIPFTLLIPGSPISPLTPGKPGGPFAPCEPCGPII